jgi:hypothetical protein
MNTIDTLMGIDIAAFSKEVRDKAIIENEEEYDILKDRLHILYKIAATAAHERGF